jgi:WD40 repeat protein
LTYKGGEIGYQRDWELRALRWPDGQVIASKFFHGSQPPILAFVKKGTKEIYGDEPSTQGVLLWLASNMEAPNVLVGGLPVGDIAFTADGRMIYTISPPFSLQSWELGNPVPRRERRIDLNSPLRLSPDGALLGGGTLDKGYQAALVDPRSGQKIRKLAGPSGLFASLAFSADSSTMAASDYNGAISIWRLADGQPLPRIEAGLGHTNIALSPDGSQVATGSNLYGLQFFNTGDGSLLRKIADSSGVIDLVYSPVLQSDGEGLLASAHQDDSVRIWRVADGSLLARLEDCAHENSFLQEPLNTGSQLAFSLDGKYLAAACGATWVWRTSDWMLQQELERFEDVASVLAFSPDSLWLATGTKRGLVLLWPLSQP